MKRGPARLELPELGPGKVAVRIDIVARTWPMAFVAMLRAVFHCANENEPRGTIEGEETGPGWRSKTLARVDP